MSLTRAAAAAAVLTAISVSACSGEVVIDPSPRTSSTSSPSSADATDPAPSSSVDKEGLRQIGTGELGTSAEAYVAALNNRSWVNVAALSCPGLQPDVDPADRDKVLEEATPKMTLQVKSISDGARLDEQSEAELADPGMDVDRWATVVFSVEKGSEYPNPTMTARYVHNPDTGWLYCGIAPNA